MFEKFTEKAKRILFLARYEASQQGSKVIGTEHILLGLLKEGEETTRELFTRANVSMDLLQAELERRNPPREKLSTSIEIPFSEETKKAGKLIAGDALQATTTATTVRVRDGKRLTTDGPFAETKEQLGGYYIVEAKDLDEALAIAAKIPSARFGSIEVRPVMKFD